MWSDFVSRSDLPLLDFHEARSLVFSYQTPLEWHVESRTLERTGGRLHLLVSAGTSSRLKNVTLFREFSVSDQEWRHGVSSKKFEIRILGAEMEILRRTPWSRIRGQNSVYNEFLEIVGNGKQTGSV